VEFEGETKKLVKYRDIASGKSITKYVKVIGKASPYDGNDPNWAARLGESLVINPSQVKILKRQKGKCARCKMYLRPEDMIETDHIDPTRTAKRNRYDNLQLLHKHCHDNKTAEDRAKKNVKNPKAE
jgi:RNA-directed DNA polymerase